MMLHWEFAGFERPGMLSLFVNGDVWRWKAWVGEAAGGDHNELGHL